MLLNKTAKRAFTPPFQYEKEGQRILDSYGHWVADLRGWGYLTGTGGLHLPTKEAAEAQDAIGEWMADLMTNNYNQ